MAIEPIKYNLGFTSASLRPELMREHAELYLQHRDWGVSKEAVLAGNLFQCTSQATSSRFEREFRGRLQQLTPAQLDILVSGSSEIRVAISWLAVVKKYVFLYHAVTRMVQPKLDQFEEILHESDYVTFLEEEADLHPEVKKISAASLGKVRRVLMRMLREVGFLSEGSGIGTLSRPYLPSEVRQVILEDDPTWLSTFLAPPLSKGSHDA